MLEVATPAIWSRRASTMSLLGLPVVALAGQNPWGWDSSGPIRWLLLPTLGFLLIALVATQPEPPATDPPPEAALSRSVPQGVDLAWVGLLGWGLAATVLAADPLHAWIGTPDRRLGWLTWVLFGGLFWAGRRLDNEQRTLLLRGVVVASIGMSLITALERFGWSPNADFAGSRLGGPFGQPAYLGAAAALAAPICVGLAVQDRDTDQRPEARIWRLVAGSAAFLSVGTLLAAQARAAWLGALVAAALLAAVRTPARRLLILPIGVPLVAVLAVPDLQNRLASAGGDGGVLAGRWDEWQVGLRALAASPVLGYGPEGYRTVFGAHVDEAYVLQWGRDVFTDRAHSGLLDTALAFGVPGAALAAAVIGLVLWRGVNEMARGTATSAGLAVGVVAALIGQQFLFPLSELDPLLWLLAGVTLADARDRSGDHLPEDQRRPAAGRRVLTGMAAGLALVFAVAGIADLAADQTVAAVAGSEEPTPGSNHSDRAVALRPDSIRYRFIAARIAAATGDLDRAQQQIAEGLQRSPADPALRSEQATLALRQAEAAQLEAGGPTPATVEAAETAVRRLTAVLADDPLRPELLNQLGFAHLLAGRPDLALEPLERSLALDPDNGFAADNLATAERIITQAGRP